MKRLTLHRLASALLCLTLALSLAACGGKKKPAPAAGNGGVKETISDSRTDQTGQADPVKPSEPEAEVDQELVEECLDKLGFDLEYGGYPGAAAYLGYREKGDTSKLSDWMLENCLDLTAEMPVMLTIPSERVLGPGYGKLFCVIPRGENTSLVGIAEGHAVTFSGGMAKDGLQPFCNIYSSFMQRAHDNIIHDVAIQNLPVVLCLDRAGLVGEDGPTHHGAFDMACLRPIPNLTISSPMDEHELRRLMYTAQLPDKGPFVIRYPRGRGVLVDWKCPLEEIPVGKGRKLKEGNDLAVITIGPIGNIATRAITRAEADFGLSIAHYDLRFLKPLDEELLHEVGRKFQSVLTIEDGIIKGGMGSAILEFMADNEYKPTVKRIGIPNIFVEHGSVAELYQLCGMDEEGILTKIKEFIN